MFFDNEINRAFRRMSGSFFDTDDIFEGNRGNSETGPYWYGYTLSIGPNGRPVLRECGTGQEAPGQGNAREPVVDTIVDEKNNTVKLIAEIPGVEKNDIQIVVDNKVVDISAARDKTRYHARVPIKRRIDENSAKASYKNGILQLVFGLVSEKPTGTKVEVE